MATAKRKNFKKAEKWSTARPAAADAATVIVQSALFYEI